MQLTQQQKSKIKNNFLLNEETKKLIHERWDSLDLIKQKMILDNLEVAEDAQVFLITEALKIDKNFQGKMQHFVLQEKQKIFTEQEQESEQQEAEEMESIISDI